MDVLIWSLDNQNFAMDLTNVISVYLACEWTHVAGNQNFVEGMVNLHGEIIPVINARKIFGIKMKELEPYDYYILIAHQQKKWLVWVDQIKKIEFQVEIVDETIVDKEGEIHFLFNPDKMILQKSLA